MIRIKSILSFISFLLLVGGAQAQDIHFSHIHASPLNLNPALAGLFDGDVRFIANYRNQWRSVTADYKTFMASADLNLRGFNKNSIFGIGAQVYSDVAGDLDFTTTGTSLSFSAMQAFDREGSHILAGGFQIGQVSNRFDASQIVSFDEEPLAQMGETNRHAYADFSAGLLWFKRMEKGHYVYMGGSMYHLNNPVVTFSDAATENKTLYRRNVVHGGASVALNDYYNIQPNFIYMKQGPHQQLTMGSFVKYQSPLKKGTPASIMLGGWVRSFNLEDRLGVDAIVTAVRIDLAQLIFTFTYDVNVSSLARASNGRGGPEFSLVYLIGSEFSNKPNNNKRDRPNRKKKKVKCPAHF